MKKVILFISLAALTLVLVAAAPIQIADAPGGSAADQVDHQNKGFCFDPFKNRLVPCSGKKWKIKVPGQGEPRMEKVTSFRYVTTGSKGGGSKCNASGVLSNKGYSWYYCVRTYELPVGCNFRYQY